MSAARLVLLLAGIGLFWMILRQVLRSWLGGPSREELLRGIDDDSSRIERETGGDVPPCPVCGSPTRLFRYPHITLWRCSLYPRCRGFVKAQKPSRPKFAEDWARKRSRRD